LVDFHFADLFFSSPAHKNDRRWSFFFFLLFFFLKKKEVDLEAVLPSFPFYSPPPSVYISAFFSPFFPPLPFLMLFSVGYYENFAHFFFFPLATFWDLGSIPPFFFSPPKVFAKFQAQGVPLTGRFPPPFLLFLDQSWLVPQVRSHPPSPFPPPPCSPGSQGREISPFFFFFFFFPRCKEDEDLCLVRVIHFVPFEVYRSFFAPFILFLLPFLSDS